MTDVTATPDRRRFLRIGGGGLLAAAVLAACSDDGPETSAGETGQTVPPVDTTLGPPQTTTPEQGTTQDQLVTRTARSFELALVETYDALLGRHNELALPAAVTLAESTTAALELLRSRHETHAQELVAVVSAAGGSSVTQANAGVLGAIVEPQIPDLTTESLILAFAHQLEDLAASTYAWGAGTLSTPALRQQLIGVAMVSARHPVLVALVDDPSGTTAVPTARVDTSGPARVPDYMLVPVDGDGGDALTEAPVAAGGDDAEGEDTDEADADAEGETPEGDAEG